MQGPCFGSSLHRASMLNIEGVICSSVATVSAMLKRLFLLLCLAFP